MKPLENWFSEYAESHQNRINTRIHYFCVPAIFFSIIGLLMSIDRSLLIRIAGISTSLWVNWASIVAVLALIFYWRLSKRVFVEMLAFTIVCMFLNMQLSRVAPLGYTSLIIFVIAWIGQFIGHHIEGKKPSFVKDLQFLLIGPAWVFEKLKR